MRELVKKFTVFFAAAVFALFASCGGGEENQDEAASVQNALDMENGGFTTEDEAADFNDPKMEEFGFSKDDAEHNDEIAGGQEFQDKDKEDGARHFFMFIAMGNITFDPAIAEWTTWDGSLTADAGLLAAVRTVLFEEGDEVRKRTNAGMIEWAIRTKPHFDGMFVKFVLPAADAGVDVNFTLTAGEYSKSFKLSDFPIEVYDSLGEGKDVVILGAEAKVGNCPFGFLMGRWHTIREDLGIFRGKWASETGRLSGVLKGIWGKRKKGNQEQVFFGKYIETSGAFKGILGGIYDGGRFEGKWLDKNKQEKGAIKGGYKAAPLRFRNGGFFLGAWGEKCGE